MPALVLGDTDAARMVCASLTRAGTEVCHLPSPDGTALLAALAPRPTAIAIVVRGDIVALRYALLIEHACPEVTLVVTAFDKTVAEQLRLVMPGCQVTSPADIAVPAIVGACLGDTILAVDENTDEPVLIESNGARTSVSRRVTPPKARRPSLATTAPRFRAYDTTSKVMSSGAAGLVAILALDWSLITFLLHESPIHAFYNAVGVVATVGPADTGSHSPTWYLLLSGMLMLSTIGFTALLTAGLVTGCCPLGRWPSWAGESCPPAVTSSWSGSGRSGFACACNRVGWEYR